MIRFPYPGMPLAIVWMKPGGYLYTSLGGTFRLIGGRCGPEITYRLDRQGD